MQHSIQLDTESRRALEYLKRLPGGFNLSRWVRDALILEAETRGMERTLIWNTVKSLIKGEE